MYGGETVRDPFNQRTTSWQESMEISTSNGYLNEIKILDDWKI